VPARFRVRRSSVHGRGVFAVADLPAGEHLVEYGGEIIPWEVAHERYADSDADEGHTYFFDRGDGTVIDGGRGGNTSRFINHGCDPNCETIDDEGRIFIETIRPIAAGEELFIDYQLCVDEPVTDELRQLYACRCGATSCRGTMLGD
jgi:uncharacterized protein